MTELYIDGIAADIGELEFTLGAAAGIIADPYGEKQKIYRIKLPKTSGNMTIFAFADEICANEFFNSRQHSAMVMEDGEIMIEGYAALVGSATEYYTVEIAGRLPEWVTSSAETAIKDTGIEFEEVLDGEVIRRSWEDGAVKFLPVARDRYESPQYVNELPPVQILTFEDYHPFMSVKELVLKIFGDAGYEVESEWLEEEARDLYMSGKYPEQDTEILKKEWISLRLKPPQ